MSPRTPGRQGPNPLSPRGPRRDGTFGGHGPSKRDAFGGAPERGKRVNASGAGGSWGGGGNSGGGGGGGTRGGCLSVVVPVLVIAPALISVIAERVG